MRLCISSLFTLMLTLNGCIIDCNYSPNVISLLVIKDGHNAIFGPDATISPDSIVFKTKDQPPIELYFYLSAERQTIMIPIEYEDQYLLEFKPIRTDTLSGIISHKNVRGKCDHYYWKEFSINGQVVCEEDCEPDIVLQL